MNPNPASKLNESSHERTGVARWPGQTTGELAAQKDYGNAFSKKSTELGPDIAGGELPDLRALWGECAKWRAEMHFNSGSTEMINFMSQRGSDGPVGTAIAERYSFMRDRVFEQKAQGLDIGPKLQKGTPGDHVHCKPALVLQHQLELANGSQVDLTQVRIYCDTEGKAPVSEFDKLRRTVTAGEMLHTNEAHLPALMDHAQQVFEAALTPDQSPESRLLKLAELHYVLAQTMPDLRGSAAKSQMTIRAMAHALSMQLPPFKEGLVPDLESFLGAKGLCA